MHNYMFPKNGHRVLKVHVPPAIPEVTSGGARVTTNPNGYVFILMYLGTKYN